MNCKCSRKVHWMSVNDFLIPCKNAMYHQICWTNLLHEPPSLPVVWMYLLMTARHTLIGFVVVFVADRVLDDATRSVHIHKCLVRNNGKYTAYWREGCFAISLLSINVLYPDTVCHYHNQQRSLVFSSIRNVSATHLHIKHYAKRAYPMTKIV